MTYLKTFVLAFLAIWNVSNVCADANRSSVPEGTANNPFAWAATVAAGLLLLLYLFTPLLGRKCLPGPWLTIPLLGDTIELATSDFATWSWNRVFRVSLLGFEVYTVADPEALRPILSDEAALFTMPAQSFNRLMGSYNTMEKKDVHGLWRRLHLAALSGGALKLLLPRVRRIIEDHVQQWERQGRVEIFEAAEMMSLDLALFAITGVDLEGNGVDLDSFKEQLKTFLAGVWALPVALPGSPLAKALAAKERLLAVLQPVLRERHDAFHSEWEACEGDLGKVAARLAESGEPMTAHKAQLLGYHAIGAQALRDSAMSVLNTIMGAADTTHFSLFTTWGLLAQLPAVQDKVYDEQKKVVAEFGPEISSRALMSMPYLEAVFKEVMRLMPSTSGGFRRLTRDVHAAGVTLPKGTVIWPHTYLLHMLDPVLWDGDTRCALPRHMDWRNNLEGVFQPERWLGDEAKRPRSFYAFGSGAHQCAGMHLVTMEAKLQMALVMRRHRVELEVPDMLHRANLFPFITPVKGTDGVRLLPREDPLPWE